MNLKFVTVQIIIIGNFEHLKTKNGEEIDDAE